MTSPATDRRSAPGSNDRSIAGISSATLLKMERSAGSLATMAVAEMDSRLSWFRTLPAAQRSWVTLVAQAGISGYVEWLISSSPPAADAGAVGLVSDIPGSPGSSSVVVGAPQVAPRPAVDGFRLTQAVFGSAPRELVRSVSLRRTVELVKIAISIAEEHFPRMGATDAERQLMTASLLRYSREVAFSAAAVYAAAAESRGAWDQRLEALVVDAIVRGESGDHLASRAAALNWDTSLPVLVLVGSPPPTEGRRTAESLLPPGSAVIGGLHASRLILVLAAQRPEDLDQAAVSLLEGFGPGPVIRGPAGVGLEGAIESAGPALSAARAARAWPGAPRGISADALLPERVLIGDSKAVETLRHKVYEPLRAAPHSLLSTLDAYLASGRALEPAARALFVHVNTVRYRLRGILDLTGLDPMNPRDALTLQIALAVGRLAEV